MSVKEAVIRGNNMLSAAIVGLAGFSFLPEGFIEDKPQYKIDDGLLFLLGLLAIGWYLKGKNKFTRSIWPVVIVWAGLAVKIMGIVIEIKEKDDVGDDFGGFILFILASVLVSWLYVKAKHIKD